MTIIRIEQWALVETPGQSPYMAPEQRSKSLHGLAYGHPDFEDGARITSSAIVKANDGVLRTATGREYTLGTPDPAYEAQFPNARQRIFAIIGSPA